MQKVSHSTIACQFCGAPLDVKCVYDDGEDWFGHYHCAGHYYEEREKCRCQLGSLEGNVKPIKKMCLNCIFYKEEKRCTNKDEIARVNSILDNHDIQFASLHVKNPEKCCEYHKLNYSIFDNLFLNTKENKNEQ